MSGKNGKPFQNQGSGLVKRIVIAAIGALLIGGCLPLWTAAQPGGPEQEAVADQVRSLTPRSIKMVDSALAVLDQRWSGMRPAEKEAFLTLADPAGTGEVDEAYVTTVFENYQKIRRAFEKDIPVIYEPAHSTCTGQRLYFTDSASLHVCPYFLIETNDARKARTLIHEYVHIALRVRDRPYYRPTSKAFAGLTPRGPWATQLPVIGPIVREIVARDTLYHPDTYAHFAFAVSGEPDALEKYLDSEADVTIFRNDSMTPDHGSGSQVTDSWLRPKASHSSGGHGS